MYPAAYGHGVMLKEVGRETPNLGGLGWSFLPAPPLPPKCSGKYSRLDKGRWSSREF